MKSYTDLEQSRKLAKILPLESADMFYSYGMDINTKKWDYDTVPTIIDASNQIDIDDISCWSLAALMELTPNDVSLLHLEDVFQAVYDIKPYHITNKFDNPLDAAFEMICWLKENNKI